MATHCQTAARNGSSERQNIGVVNSFEGKKKGGGQLQTKHLVKCVVFTLFCEMMFITLHVVE